MDWTDTHCRTFHRLMTRRALLYTEMVTTGAILHGPRDRLLGHDASEHPVALQLGGSDPRELAEAARIASDYGYDEINLNCGCPSDRVQNGRFGACLMREPELVGRCVEALKAAVDVPVTVKCRIGVDDQDPAPGAGRARRSGRERRGRRRHRARAQGLASGPVAEGEPRRATARLRPRPCAEARAAGPLRGHQWRDREQRSAAEQLEWVDGVMLGRAAYHNPELLLDVDARFFDAPRPVEDGAEAVMLFMPYMARKLETGVRLHDMTRHLLGLFAGRPGARAWRHHLATHGSVAGRRPRRGKERARQSDSRRPGSDRPPEHLRQ